MTSQPRLAALFIVLILGLTASVGCVASDEGRAGPQASGSTALPTAVAPQDDILREMVLDLDLRGDAANVVAEAAHDTGAALGVAVRDTGAGPRLTASHQEQPGGRLSVVTRQWGAFAPFWSERTGLDHAELSNVALYLPMEHRDAVASFVPEAAVAEARWLPAGEIATALDDDPGGVALLPLELASPRLRSLAVEGVDPVRDEGASRESTLVETIWLAWSDPHLDAFAEDLAMRLAAPPIAVTRLLITGDIIPARCVYARQDALDDYTAAFAETKSVLAAADITIGSLDAAISDVGVPVACEETFNLLAPARSIEGFVAAGFDVITVATNHAKDCGSIGLVCENRSFRDTLSLMAEAGIRTVGGGEDLKEAHAPAVVERNGVRFAFLGYDDVSSAFLGASETLPGTAPLSSEALLSDVAAAREVADVVVVLPQWGIEYAPDPSYRQMQFGREAIEAGAHLVAGNHPHVVQGVEWVDDGFIAYALGNFIFDQDWSLETQEGAVLEAIFHGDRLASVRLLPTRVVNMFQATWAEPWEAAQILDRMEVSSRALAPR